MNVQESLLLNIEWFLKSGIMRPASGEWGVAERIVISGNKALKMVLSAFPYYTEVRGGFILEHRRPDCNFETAWLFAVASEALHKPELLDVAGNILDFLFRRSGLMNKSYPDLPEAVWEWSSNNLKNQFYYDDNGWNGLLQLALAKRYPEFDRRFHLRFWGLKLCNTLANALKNEFFGHAPHTIIGKPELPHWGAVCCMAIAAAALETGNGEYGKVVQRYFRYLDDQFDSFNTSELAYIAMGGGIAAGLLDDYTIRSTAEHATAVLLNHMKVSGNIASEHYEIPNGYDLVDLIYTMNWTLLGLQEVAALTGKAIHLQGFETVSHLLIGIQDRTPDPLFKGCWRGLYDRKRGSWSGGDLHEGGSGSIYSGWTNAPIAIALAHHLNGISFAEVLKGSLCPA